MGIGPEIIITVSPKSIDFQWNQNRLHLEPFVNIDPEKMAPIQIGKDEALADSFLVGVFDPKSEIPSYPDKFPFLQMIFGYGIGKLFENQRLPVFRPLVIIRGERSLNELLGGYQRTLIYEAVMRAHARECRFE